MGGIQKECGCWEGPLSEQDPTWTVIPCSFHARDGVGEKMTVPKQLKKKKGRRRR